MVEQRRLTRIQRANYDRYVVTLTTVGGRDIDYDFNIVREFVNVIESCERFGREVDSYGHSALVYEAIAAFRDSHEGQDGEPEGYEFAHYERQSDPANGTQVEQLATDKKRLTSIKSATPNVYIVTFTTKDGHEKTYEFTIAHSQGLSKIQADEFDHDMRSSESKYLIRKAVIAFHDSHEKLVGRPDGYEAPLPQDDPGRAD